MDKELFKKEIADNGIKWYDFKKDSSILDLRENIVEYSEKNFDYIIIKDHMEQIENVQKYLKPDGVILFLVNNKYGLANSSKANTYTKAEIERTLRS